MAKSKFSKLLFDKTKIPSMINNWCELNLDGEYSISQNNNKQQDLYSITTNGEEIKISFINAAGGAITIYPGVGNNQDKSTMIAEYIYENIAPEITKSPFANGFSIKMPEEDLKTLLDFINEYDDIECTNYSKQDKPGQAKYELYKYKSSLGDTVVLKYYSNTSRLQIQGKPLYLFNEIVSLIGQQDDKADALVNAHIEMCNLNISKEEISDELSSILGAELYSFLTRTQRAFLNSSIVLSKVRVESLEDYSYMISPALKAYEGFLLKLMASEKIILPAKKKNVGEFFTRPDKKVEFTLKSEYNNNLEQKKVDIFEEMYNYYSRNRHPYMHCTDLDVTTSVVGSFDVATNLLDSIINDLKIHYAKFNLK